MGQTPVAYIDATGCHLPSFAEERAYFDGVFRACFGDDISLDNATPDGQFSGLLTTALHDCNSGILASWNAYSPGTAQGISLSSLVKLNGIARSVSTYSSANLTIVGQAGTSINDAYVADNAGFQWSIPDCVIPDTGELVVTAVCLSPGAIQAAPGTITSIQTITQGWQQVFNLQAAVPGGPVESDAALERRRTVSTSIPARTVTEATLGAILAIPGVTSAQAYENDQNTTDERGLPPHSVAYVVRGGDDQAIGDMIRRKKGICATYGSSVVTSFDRAGVPHEIRFFRQTAVPITVYLNVTPLRGYTSNVQTRIAETLALWVTAQAQGTEIVRSRAMAPATFNGEYPSSTYKITDLQFGRDGGGPTKTDIELAFFEVPTCDPESVQFYIPQTAS